MKAVMNATDEQHTVRALGNWFTFKPKQVKVLNEDLASFIVSKRAHLGFVPLSERYAEDLEYRDSAEGKAELEAKRKEGVANFISHLKRIVRNNTDALRNDMRSANIDSDPSVNWSEEGLATLETLVKYQTKGEDEIEQRVKRVKELEKKLKGKA